MRPHKLQSTTLRDTDFATASCHCKLCGALLLTSWFCQQGLRFFGGADLDADDFMRAMNWESDHPEDRVVIVSDIWLDQPLHLAHLRSILAGMLTAPTTSCQRISQASDPLLRFQLHE